MHTGIPVATSKKVPVSLMNSLHRVRLYPRLDSMTLFHQASNSSVPGCIPNNNIDRGTLLIFHSAREHALSSLSAKTSPMGIQSSCIVAGHPENRVGVGVT